MFLYFIISLQLVCSVTAHLPEGFLLVMKETSPENGELEILQVGKILIFLSE